MRLRINLFILLTLLCGLAATPMIANAEDVSPDKSLVILWTSADREVAEKMVFIYALNAKKYEWWDQITFIVWGPSAKLLSEDPELQKQIKDLMEVGVDVKACLWCSDQYGVSDQCRAMGIDVKYMGRELTDLVQAGWELMTF